LEPVPLYEYECRACGHRFERIQKFSDPLVRKCPQCGKKKVEKLLSAPAVQFKGSGWYVTDYARKGAGAGPPAGSESGKEAGEKEPGKKAGEKKAAAGAEGGGKEGAGRGHSARKGGRKD
jgi:putative FmdB family regulatory protein